MDIDGRKIDNDHPPYLVAEISCNHLGRLDYALKLIEAAKEAGADAAKFQCYQADTITLDCDKPDFIIQDGPWKGRKLHELYKKCETPREWFPKLLAKGREIGITVFSSVFSPGDMAFLEELGCPAYKIASMEITDIPLIEAVVATDKPVILSTGMATQNEISEARRRLRLNKGAVLHCVSGYPTPLAESSLWRMNRMDGISDHTTGWEVSVAATVLGAKIIEKHLKLPIFEFSEDEPFSLTPIAFSIMARTTKDVWQAMQKTEAKSEESSRQLRRSLYAVKDIKSCEEFTPENVRSIRPSYGLPPKELPNVLGGFATCNIERGTALKEEMIENVPF
jgi:pseudaminic acid synthase